MSDQDIKMRILEPYSYEYWKQYHLRLINFIEYYKKGLDNKPTEENINFNYNVEFFSEKYAGLVAEKNRIEMILSILKHKYDIEEI